MDGSYEPAVEDSPEKCGWGLHILRFLSRGNVAAPIFCGLLRENTRVFKLSKELVALVHAFGVCLFSALKSLLHDLF